ncbi:MAG: hypothetical protein NZ949_04255, partial [Candidatus Kapabacteria bacterium]|nr:hypothetical protein [Candidatus Kapabacteria bacterium]
WHTWRQLTHLRLPGYPQESEIPDITFVPDQPNLGFLAVTFLFDTTVGGRSNGGLYRTTDGGHTWQLFAFPDTSLWSVATYWHRGGLEIAVGGFTLYPDTLGRPLVPGSGIVRTSPDNGQQWIIHDEAIPWVHTEKIYRRVWRIKYSPTGTLYIATEAGLYARTPPTLVPSATISIAPAAILLQGKEWHLQAPCTGLLRIAQLTGETVLQTWLGTAERRLLSLSTLASGIYVAELLYSGIPRHRWILLVL